MTRIVFLAWGSWMALAAMAGRAVTAQTVELAVDGDIEAPAQTTPNAMDGSGDNRVPLPFDQRIKAAKNPKLEANATEPSAPAEAGPCGPPRAATLKEAVGGRFDVGVGVGLESLKTPENQPLIVHHFNYITPENCMKFAAIQPREGQFRFEKADQVVQFAQDNNLKVLGHCLVWAKDDRTPEWFYREGDQEVRPEVLMHRMKTHIKTVVQRYKGRVHSWDVVNEAIGDRNNEYLRDSVWAKLLKDDFIVEAFRYTHELDPDALLIYNDYHLHQRWRRDRMERIIRKLRREGAPISAIGIQGHYNLDAVPYDELEQLLILLRELKLKIAISELDVDVIPRDVWWANGGRDREKLKQYNPYPNGCPPELLTRQAEQFAGLFDLFQKYEDVILRVSFWNLHDGESWLNSFPWKRDNYPTLFDRNRQPKPAFYAVMDSLTRGRPAGPTATPADQSSPSVPGDPGDVRNGSTSTTSRALK